ncbi:MAG: hypothetical protein ACEPOZ_00915 [Marinifilaceae bacterium]
MKNPKIPCAFYDELEAIALQKQKVTIIFKDPHDTQTMVNGTIEDLFTKEKIEYLKLNSGWIVPLHRIVSAGNKNIDDYKYC